MIITTLKKFHKFLKEKIVFLQTPAINGNQLPEKEIDEEGVYSADTQPYGVNPFDETPVLTYTKGTNTGVTNIVKDTALNDRVELPDGFLQLRKELEQLSVSDANDLFNEQAMLGIFMRDANEVAQKYQLNQEEKTIFQDAYQRILNLERKSHLKGQHQATFLKIKGHLHLFALDAKKDLFNHLSSDYLYLKNAHQQLLAELSPAQDGNEIQYLGVLTRLIDKIVDISLEKRKEPEEKNWHQLTLPELKAALDKQSKELDKLAPNWSRYSDNIFALSSILKTKPSDWLPDNQKDLTELKYRLKNLRRQEERAAERIPDITENLEELLALSEEILTQNNDLPEKDLVVLQQLAQNLELLLTSIQRHSDQ